MSTCKPVLRLAGALVLVLLPLSACGDDDDAVDEDGAEVTTPGGADEGEDGAGDDGGSGAAGVVEDGSVAVSMGDFSFSPDSITGGEGTVTVELTNVGAAPHTFTIDDAGVDVEVGPGESGEAEVEVGSEDLEFYCRFHEGQGMKGTFAAG